MYSTMQFSGGVVLGAGLCGMGIAFVLATQTAECPQWVRGLITVIMLTAGTFITGGALAISFG